MCWTDEGARGEGLLVTLIADNYFGYCKKEIKTQISYSANPFGMAEEEYAGIERARGRFTESAISRPRARSPLG